MIRGFRPGRTSVKVLVILVRSIRPCCPQTNINFVKHNWDTYVLFYKYASLVLPSLERVLYIRDRKAQRRKANASLFVLKTILLTLLQNEGRMRRSAWVLLYGVCQEAKKPWREPHPNLRSATSWMSRHLRWTPRSFLKNSSIWLHAAWCRTTHSFPHALPCYLSAHYCLADETGLRYHPKCLYASLPPLVDCD